MKNFKFKLISFSKEQLDNFPCNGAILNTHLMLFPSSTCFCRREVYKILNTNGIDTPEFAVVDRDNADRPSPGMPHPLILSRS